MDNRHGDSRGGHSSRDSRKGGFRGNRGSGDRGGYRGNQGPREMHKAICADCGKECEVPFKPTGERPVYCRECFGKHKTF